MYYVKFGIIFKGENPNDGFSFKFSFISLATYSFEFYCKDKESYRLK